MRNRNYLAAAVAHGQRRKVQGIDPKKYALSIWKLFIAADMAETAAMEIEELLRPAERFVHDDKRRIQAIKANANKFVYDVDKTCTPEFAEQFADISNACHTLLNSYMTNQLAKMHDIWAERKEQ